MSDNDLLLLTKDAPYADNCRWVWVYRKCVGGWVGGARGGGR